MPDATGKHWYLVQCKPRQSRRALEHLERQGYQCLLPLYQIERTHKGQLQELDEPLFPGYLFINLSKNDDNWLPIRSTRGVSHIVSFGGLPASIPDSVIDHLRYPRPVTSATFASGDRVSITDPGFEYVEAIFLEKNGDDRVLLLLKLLQRNVIVRVPLRNIKRAEGN